MVVAALAGAFAFVFFNALTRVESRAHWRREEGIRRSRRIERRAFIIGVLLVLAMVAAGIIIQLARRPGCNGTVVLVPGPRGAALECVCERGRRGVCFEPGP